MHFLQTGYLPLFFLLFIPLAGGFWGLTQSRNILRAWMNSSYAKGAPFWIRYRKQALWQIFFTSLSLLFLFLAILRPVWDYHEQKVEENGRDIVFLIDVSRSMLAEDILPSRLERARIEINNWVGSLQGDRVALVAFAGTSVMKCPLTLDYTFFQESLNSLYPGEISRGGSLLGDAIRFTLDTVFDNVSGKSGDIILITDGEDQESYPVEAARTAGDKGLRLLVIGLGKEQGSPIPLSGRDGTIKNLQYEGKDVITRLNADMLRQMASATPGGRFLNVSSGSFDLEDIYENMIKTEAGKRTGESVRIVYKESFPLLLFLALIMFLLGQIQTLVPLSGFTVPFKEARKP